MSPGASDGLLYLDLYNFTILEWLQSFLKQHMSVQHVMLILNVLELKKMRYKFINFVANLVIISLIEMKTC